MLDFRNRLRPVINFCFEFLGHVSRMGNAASDLLNNRNGAFNFDDVVVLASEEATMMTARRASGFSISLERAARGSRGRFTVI